jgi:hypothetical protein
MLEWLIYWGYYYYYYWGYYLLVNLLGFTAVFIASCPYIIVRF